MWAVVAGHAADLWGVVLVTAGVLAAVAFYANSLGPAGHDVRLALGDVLGWGRFLVPPVAIAVGILLIVGRREGEEEARSTPEPARAVIGASLTLLSVAGLASLAGGSPRFGASTTSLSSAGGWVGALIGNPLRSALGGFGAATVLMAMLVAAMVLFTGVSVSSAVGAAVRATRWSAALARGGSPSEDEAEDEDEDEPTDPFGRAVSARTKEAADEADEGAEPPSDEVVADPVVAEPEPPDPEALPEAATRPGRGAQLEMKLGPTVGDWRLPPANLLKRAKPQAIDEKEVDAAGAALVSALAAHGVETRLVGRTVGPSVTRYELELGAGVKVARVTSLSKDIAYAMASPDVRILAPIPGKSAIGVEVPNRHRQLVALGDILASPEAAGAKHPLEVALGRDIAGRAVMVNLAEMPHVLVSGATGSGKSSCINSVLTSILTRATPDQVRLILVDPKRVELGQYNDLPHLLTQVVVDPKKAANALSWAVTEMERRYDLLAEVGMRDITGYNAGFDDGHLAQFEEDYQYRMRGTETETDDEGEGEDGEIEPRFHRLPFIVIVVDELNDLMMVAARDVEESVCRIAQMARAVGIHLVLATQRPSVDVITGVIKANIPSRMAFSVSSLADSRVILDQPGAERLIGMGDLLLLTASSSNPQRLQGPWVSEEEVRAVAAHWKRQRPMEVVAGIEEVVGKEGPRSGGEDGDDDLLDEAMELVVRSQLGSTSMLQRKLRVGFARAGRLMDLMERRGVVGPSEGSKARAVLMTPEELDAR
ncbi:MAG TPA: DNA translocase FtsK 4TM domain-containing protein [Acidimicrobiales bacterium]|nr:DNA translocase FtsK 4TM domain-containing protein [Acidimicrobiales bacterium]